MTINVEKINLNCVLLLFENKVQEESYDRSTPVAEPFVAKCCVPVMFWAFNYRVVHLT